MTIRGFHGATLLVRDTGPTARLLTETMGFTVANEKGDRTRYAMGDGAPGAQVDLVGAPDLTPGDVVAGITHHIAWRTPDEESESRWRRALGLDVTGVRDREYFRSIYFHEPGDILFEIATE